jgi:hypothetical protein
VAALLRRATGALPEDATGSATSVAVRVDAGYFSGEFALECLWQGIDFAIGPMDRHRLGPHTLLYCPNTSE